LALASLLLVAAASYAPAADARGHGHGARIAGAVILGAAIARPLYYAPRVYYAAPVYYPPAVYYPPPAYYPSPPAVVYSTPPVYVERAVAPPAASLPIEERLRRLQSACGQGLLSADECEAKRRELMRLM
jgi:hypothetical protein